MKEYIEYELIYIVPINNFERSDSIKKDIREIIEENEGKIIKEGSPQKRKLAYPIKGKRNGTYFISRVLIEKDKIRKIEKDLRVKTKEDILRYLLVKADSLPGLEEEKTEERAKGEKVLKEIKEDKKIEATKLKDKKEPEEEKTVEILTPSPKKVKKEIKVELKKKVKPEKKEKKKEMPETEKKEPTKKETAPQKTTDEKDKLKFEELDKKIDEILKDDLL
jgi:ribosomal protein S6